MKYKVVAIDIDGTISNDFNFVSKLTRITIQNLLSLGVKVVFVTGRAWQRAMTVIKKIAINHENLYLAAYNGGYIAHLKEQEPTLIKEITFDPQEVRWMHQLANDFNVVVWNYGREADQDPKIHGYTSKSRSLAIGFLKFINKASLSYYDPDKHTALKSYKIDLCGNDKNIAKFEKWMLQEKAYPHYAYRMGIHFLTHFREINPIGVSKTEALKFLVKEWGLTANDVIAFGNGHNDVEMLKWAKAGIAVKNAVKRAKKVANHTTDSWRRDGVAKRLKLIFNI